MLALTLADFNFIGTANAQSFGGVGGITGFLPIVAIFVIVYFLILRPENKRKKEHREMVSALKRGDKVIVANGILGVVSKIIDNNEVSIEISPDVNIKVVRSSVTQVISKTIKEKASSDKPSEKKTKSIKTKAAAKKTTTKKAVTRK